MPITSPRNSEGVSTSTAMMGSRRIGAALRQAASNAIAPAASKAMAVEVAWWYSASHQRHPDVQRGVPVDDPGPERGGHAPLHGGHQLFRQRAVGDP